MSMGELFSLARPRRRVQVRKAVFDAEWISRCAELGGVPQLCYSGNGKCCAGTTGDRPAPVAPTSEPVPAPKPKPPKVERIKVPKAPKKITPSDTIEDANKRFTRLSGSEKSSKAAVNKHIARLIAVAERRKLGAYVTPLSEDPRHWSINEIGEYNELIAFTKAMSEALIALHALPQTEIEKSGFAVLVKTPGGKALVNSITEAMIRSVLRPADFIHNITLRDLSDNEAQFGPQSGSAPILRYAFQFANAKQLLSAYNGIEALKNDAKEGNWWGVASSLLVKPAASRMSGLDDQLLPLLAVIGLIVLSR